MSTLQLASDTTGRIVVEWNKYPPHFRIRDGSRERAYLSEKDAMAAAKRACRRLGLTLLRDYDPNPFKLMAKEFPEFDQDTLPAIPHSWTDSSWHNDVCPSFVVEDIGVQVFIDFEKTEEREFPGSESRFIVTGMASDPIDDLLQTDDWTKVLALVEARS